MRLTALLSAIVLALVLGGCGKKGEKAGEKAGEKKAQTEEKKVEKKAEEKAEAPAAEEKTEEAPVAEEKKEEAPVAEEKKEEAPAVEEKKEEAPAVEEKKEEAPAVEEKKEEAPAAEEKKEEAKKPGQLDIQKRRERIQEIYKLGRSKSEEDFKKLAAIITGEGEAFEKATAIRALGSVKKDELVPELKKLAEEKDLAVKSEAAILLYQWGEKEHATPILEKLLTQGVALRRAFFKGIQNGKYVYDEEAIPFFEKAMSAKQVHVRLDAALGLLHMSKSEAALAAFKEALNDKDKEYVRLTAVSYLASARDVPEARALLELATQDASVKVATRAKQILGTNVPKAAPAK